MRAGVVRDWVPDAMSLRDQGLPWREVARALSVGAGSARAALVSLGYSPRKTPAQAARRRTRAVGKHLLWDGPYRNCPIHISWAGGKVVRYYSARRLLYESERGALAPGRILYGGCGQERCVSPACATFLKPGRRVGPTRGQ